MAVKPILFNTEMTRAILDNRKTVTRRVIKALANCPKNGVVIGPQEGTGLYTYFTDDPEWEICALSDNRLTFKLPYQPGDILYVCKEITGYDCKYACDLEGSIFSKASGKWKKLKPHLEGSYFRLTLRKDGKDKNKCVHNLMCETWYGEKPFEKAIVRHLDGDSKNNKANNLDWGTYSQNWDDRKSDMNGIHENHHNAKITMQDAIDMRRSGKSYQELCKIYKLTAKTVQRILNNETWIENYDRTPPNIERWLPNENIWLKVTDVRVERLQDMDCEDAMKEGIDPRVCINLKHTVVKFSKLWNSTVKKKDLPLHGWDANPWVWVIEFERTEKPKE